MNASRIEKTLLKVVDRWIESPPRVMRCSFLRGIFRVNQHSSDPYVYLTFDDGPIPESTPWLLDLLDRYNVKATFFMVGDNVRKYPELYEEVRRRGHKVGNHTMHHLDGSRIWTTRYVRDVEEAAKYIDSDLLRPPHGWMRVLQREYLCKKYRIVMYDVVTRDYSKYVNADRVFANVKKYTRPGSIIVFHDSLKSIAKLKTALPRSIEWLCEQGYRFGLVPGLNYE